MLTGMNSSIPSFQYPYLCAGVNEVHSFLPDAWQRSNVSFDMERPVLFMIQLRRVKSSMTDRLHTVKDYTLTLARKYTFQYQRCKGLGQNTHIKEGAVVMRLNMIKCTKKGHKHEVTWIGSLLSARHQ